MTDATTHPDIEARIAEITANEEAEQERRLTKAQAELMKHIRSRIGADLCDQLPVRIGSCQASTYPSGSRSYACAEFSYRAFNWRITESRNFDLFLRRADLDDHTGREFSSDQGLLIAIRDLSLLPRPAAAESGRDPLPDVFNEIRAELKRIDQLHNNPRHSVGAWLTVMRDELWEADRAWTHNDGDKDALDEIVQVAATAVACLRQFRPGLPF